MTVPAGATALTAEEASAIFLKRLIIGAFQIRNPNTGVTLEVYVGDDGTLHSDPIT